MHPGDAAQAGADVFEFGEVVHTKAQADDGGLTADISPTYGTGGSYFQKGNISSVAITNLETFAYIGGQGAKCSDFNTQGGDGGVAGKGGTVKVSENA